MMRLMRLMRLMRSALVACLFFQTGFLAASEASGSSTTVGVLYGHDNLNNNTPDWHQTAVHVKREFSRRHVLDVGVAGTRRFGIRDDQLNAVYARPLLPALALGLEANASSTHRVLPRYGIGATVQAEVARGWLVNAGAKTTSYDEVRVNQGILALEQYVGSFSWQLGWRPGRAFGRSVRTGELRAAYYYGNKNSVGIIYARGDEATNLGTRVVLAQVRGAALVGQHWLDRHWMISYAVGHTRQGNFYDRSGLNLGIHYTF